MTQNEKIRTEAYRIIDPNNKRRAWVLHPNVPVIALVEFYEMKNK